MQSTKERLQDAYHAEKGGARFRRDRQSHWTDVDFGDLPTWSELRDVCSGLLPYSHVHVATVFRKVAAARKKHGNVPADVDRFFDDALAFAERWTAILEAETALKPLVVKGRVAVPDSERKTPPRTIDNTGTCACCERNVKLSTDDRIVDHGFQITWGSRDGRCLGVGYPPVEVGTEGLLYLRSVIESQASAIDAIVARLATGTEPVADPYKFDGFGRRPAKIEWTRPGEPGYERALEFRKREADGQATMTRSELDRTRRRIEAWKPTPLPDGRADHVPAMEGDGADVPGFSP